MKEFSRYTFASGVAMLLDLGLLYALTEWFGFYYLLSATIGFCCGATLVYLLSVSWAFSHRSIEDQRLEFIIFVGIGVLSLGLNNLLIWSLTEIAGLHYMFSKIVTTGAVFLFNYYTRRKFLFTPNDAKAKSSL